MKKSFIKKGFTLIELLVVITIIGILATGAVTVYTSQIQKGRDATRITSVESLKSGIEQAYQDGSEYPAPSGFLVVKTYVPVLPKDPKTNQSTNDTALEYAYNVGPSENGIYRQVYEVSCGFENQGNTKQKAENDGGNDDARYEAGIVMASGPTVLDTKLKGKTSFNGIISWVGGDSIGDSCVQSSTSEGADATGEECGDDQYTGTGKILIIK